jgi:predicted acetyltransferase
MTTGQWESQPQLRLRPLRMEDEQEFLAGHHVMSQTDDFAFALGYRPGMTWPGYLRALEFSHTGVNLPRGYVPGTLLAAVVGDEIVGRTSIRHRLNEFLLRQGGHIGYGVLPAHRRRGYATEILRQSLIIARSLGVDRVLVTCDDSNLASATVIERCGGKLDSVASGDDGHVVRRYWID